MVLGVITNNYIYRWELFHHTHVIEKQIQNSLHNLLFPADRVEQYIFHLPKLVRSA